MNAMIRTTRIMVFLLVGIFSAGTCRSQNVIGTVLLQSWRDVTADVARFCTAMDIPMAPIQFNLIGSRLLRAPNLAGLDVDRPVLLFLVQSPNPFEPPRIVVRMPLTDKGAYLAAVRAEYPESNEDNGMLNFTAPAGNEALALCFSEKGDAVFAGTDGDKVRHVARNDRDELVTDFPSVPGKIKAAFDLKTFWPTVEALLSMATPSKAGATPDAGAERESIGWRPLMNFIKGLERFAVGLDVNGEGIFVDFQMEAEARSDMARSFAMQRPPEARHAGFLPAEASLGVVGGGMDAFALLAEPYSVFLESVFRQSEIPAEKIEEFREAWVKTASNYSGSYAVGIFEDVRTNALIYASVYGVKDPVEAGETVRDGMILQNEWMSAGGELPADFISPAGQREYKGYEINVYTLKIPEDAKSDFPPQMSVLLDGLAVEVCVAGHDLVTSAGTPGSMDQVLDRLNASSGDRFPEQVNSLFGFHEPNVSEYFRFAPIGLIRAFIKTLPEADTAAILSILPQSASGIGGVQTGSETTLAGRLRAPIEECRSYSALGKALEQMGTALLMQGIRGKENGEIPEE